MTAKFRHPNRRFNRRKRGERGATLVEFALTFVLLFTVIGLLIQGALVFTGWLIVTNSVTEGARRGAPCFAREIEECTQDEIRDWAIAAAGPADPDQLTIVVTADDSILSVDGVYSIPRLMPFLDAIVPDPIPVTAHARMRLENGEDTGESTPLPTSTPAPPTDTPAPPPTNTPVVPPTKTPGPPPTKTPVPTDTPAPPTNTPVPTDTPVPTSTPTVAATPTATPPTPCPTLPNGKPKPSC